MKHRLKPLNKQVIVITGASSGIGLTTAYLAAKRGATVMALARNEDALRTLVDEIRVGGGKASYAVCDVGNEAEVQRALDTAVQEFGQIDTWVNNAGISIFGQSWQVPIEDWRRMFDTVYWGTVYGSRAAVRYFLERKQ